MNTKVILAISAAVVFAVILAALAMERSARERTAAYMANIKANPPAATAEPAPAAGSGAQEKAPSATEACGVVSKFARTIMTRRQQGESMAALVEASEKGDASIRQLSTSIIVMAYDRPRFSSQEYVDAAVTDFENEIYLQCLKSRNANAI